MSRTRAMAALHRVRSVDRAELQFRIAGASRRLADRVKTVVTPEAWDRRQLARRLGAVSSRPSAAFDIARSALNRGEWSDAHRALAVHFRSHGSAFPLDPRNIDAIAAEVAARFPEALPNALAKADRIIAGRYELLGYTDAPVGAPPRWDFDPIHRRTAPRRFWSKVPYLDPASGDHKIIWEINRHQHWLTLARAYHLTHERRFYDEFVHQLESWMRSNPPLQGINWASMLELAFRSISWLWALHFFAAAGADDTERDPAWIVDLLLGIDRQLDHVEQNLSQYFSPNTHLTGEALALYVAGCALPELRHSARRADLGRRILLEQIDRQVNADGGHAELSTHYHRYSTDFYLLALQVARAADDPAAVRFEQAARRQAEFLRVIADDNGRIPLIGDDDGGQLFPMCGRPPSDCRATLAAAALVLDAGDLAVGEPVEETMWLCGCTIAGARVPRPSAALTGSGYFVSRQGRGSHLVFDAGRHGFLNGGHAHADALSVVLTIGGTPFLVDPGTATYTMDPARRDRFRSTAMHNTVVVNAMPQSLPAGPFHWKARHDADASLWRLDDRFDYLEGRHRAYDPIIHVRGVLAVAGVGWFVVDHLLADSDAAADAFWHVHPDWTVIASAPSFVTLRHTNGSIAAISASVPLSVLTGPEAGGLDEFAPVYGKVERGTCVIGHFNDRLPSTFAAFVPSEGRTGPPTVEPMEVSSDAGSGWHCSAFKIAAGGLDRILLASVERDGVPRSAASAPGRVWGSSEARTDGRLALVSGAGDAPVVVNGTRVERALASSLQDVAATRRARR